MLKDSIYVHFQHKNIATVSASLPARGSCCNPPHTNSPHGHFKETFAWITSVFVPVTNSELLLTATFIECNGHSRVAQNVKPHTAVV